MKSPSLYLWFSFSHQHNRRGFTHYYPQSILTTSAWVNWKSKPAKTQAWVWLSRRFKRIMETAEKENNIICAGWMARGKHGWNNTIESRLLIKGGNLAKLVPARRAAPANPDISSSDLHHSSPRARINRPLTPCKTLPGKVLWIDGAQTGKNCKHTHVQT